MKETLGRKPASSVAEYRQWLIHVLHVRAGSITPMYYERIASGLGVEWARHRVISLLEDELQRWDVRYSDKLGGGLLLNRERPFGTLPARGVYHYGPLAIKPYASFLEKTWRKNVLDNPFWPTSPSVHGWIVPDTWFSEINDVVRTMIVVKYADGVEFVVNQLSQFFSSMPDFDTEHYFVALDDGYYAAHFYVTTELEIVGYGTRKRNIRSTLEIHVTTQLQSVVRQLLHECYEASRLLPTWTPDKIVRMLGRYYHARCLGGQKRTEFVSPDAIIVATKCGICGQPLFRPRKDWRWNLNSDTFRVNYLGHVLHYLENAILEARTRGRIAGG